MFDAAIFDPAIFDTGGAAVVTRAGVKHKKRQTYTVRTPSGTHVFDTQAEANAFIGAEQRRLAAQRKELATQGVFTPKVRLEAVRTDLEPDLPPVPSSYLKVAPAPEFTAPPLDAAAAQAYLRLRDDEDALAAILEWL